MGKIISKIKDPLYYASDTVTEIITRRKRKREEDSCDDISSALEKSLQVPKRRKLLTTTQYIYKTLFKEEKNFDVSVLALGKVWHLHKIYLCQSPYFCSMFNGSWKESDQNFINIRIADSRITVEALDAIFGSLYLDEIEIEPLSVIAVLAAATLLQMDSIIEKCIEIMIETTNAETAVQYYDASCQYGVQKVKKAAFDWLLANLLSFYNKHTKWLKFISIDLMTELVNSSDLYVMQTEFTLYSLLRTWVFIKLFPSYDPSDKSKDTKELGMTPQKFFSKRTDRIPFLYTVDGKQFEKTFQALKVQHLIIHHIDFKIVAEDNIIPREWLHSLAFKHWKYILKVDHTLERGPTEAKDKIFYKNCIRYGRILQDRNYQKWRWTGFHFGLDLVFVADGRVFTIRRHHKNEHERLLSLQTKRQLLVKATVASLNEQRQVTHSQTTGIKAISLERNEETSLMLLDTELTYPLLVSVNILALSPEDIQKLSNENELVNGNVNVPISDFGTSDDTQNSRSNNSVNGILSARAVDNSDGLDNNS